MGERNSEQEISKLVKKWSREIIRPSIGARIKRIIPPLMIAHNNEWLFRRIHGDTINTSVPKFSLIKAPKINPTESPSQPTFGTKCRSRYVHGIIKCQVTLINQELCLAFLALCLPLSHHMLLQCNSDPGAHGCCNGNSFDIRTLHRRRTGLAKCLNECGVVLEKLVTFE